jgi:hypothetical protein
MVIKQISAHRFHCDLPIAIVLKKLADIAKLLGLKLDRYEVDGLGPAQGVLVKTESGRVFALESLEAANDRLGPHFAISVDANEIDEHGLDRLVFEAIEAFGLSATDLQRNEGVEQTARRLAGYDPS